MKRVGEIKVITRTHFKLSDWPFHHIRLCLDSSKDIHLPLCPRESVTYSSARQWCMVSSTTTNTPPTTTPQLNTLHHSGILTHTVPSSTPWAAPRHLPISRSPSFSSSASSNFPVFSLLFLYFLLFSITIIFLNFFSFFIVFIIIKLEILILVFWTTIYIMNRFAKAVLNSCYLLAKVKFINKQKRNSPTLHQNPPPPSYLLQLLQARYCRLLHSTVLKIKQRRYSPCVF